MPKEEWGVKRVCPKCSTRFYDLRKDPMTCPSCGASFDVESLVQQKSPAAVAAKPAEEVLAPAAAPVDDLDEAVVDLEDDAAAPDDLADDILEDDDDDTVALEEIADVATDDDES